MLFSFFLFCWLFVNLYYALNYLGTLIQSSTLLDYGMSSASSLADLPVIVEALKNADMAAIKGFIWSLPFRYKEWWLELYRESPAHIFVETALVMFVLWLLFIRRTVDPVKTSDVDKFTDKEVAWLVETWEPEPLVSGEVSARDMRRSHGSKLVSLLWNFCHYSAYRRRISIRLWRKSRAIISPLPALIPLY